MTFGPLFFAAPAALLALLALPALFWILKAEPDAPRRAVFPPVRILLGLRAEEKSSERAPPWLLALRLSIAALAILGLSRPSLAPQIAPALAGGGPALVIIDDGWPSAPFWSELKAAADEAIGAAERAGRSVALLPTAPDRAAPMPLDILSPAEARARLSALAPKSWRPDRDIAARRLALTRGAFGAATWVADGLDDPGALRFAEAVKARGPLAVRAPHRTALALIAAHAGASGVETTVRRAPGGPGIGAVAAETADGRSLGAAEFAFFNRNDAQVKIALPPEIAARAARVRIVGERSAGAVRLLAGAAGHPLVGVAAPAAQGQPLLSETFYLERALAPFAAVRTGEVAALIDAGVGALAVTDSAQLDPAERALLAQWIAKGGLLIRFAGPRLANAPDELLPARLRPGSRTLGGAMAWESEQGLDAFPADGPFADLSAPTDVAVRRQVLADPTSGTARVWARLADGAPLVTAAQRGRGMIVLFHVTSGPDWSDLPLSGLFPALLQRTVALAGRALSAPDAGGRSGPYRAEQLLDGYGALSPARSDSPAIDAVAFGKASASALAPPGVYAQAGGPAVPLDAASANESLAQLRLPPGVALGDLGGADARPLAGPLLALAALLFAADLGLALALAGRLPRWKRLAAVAAVAIVIAPALARAETRDPSLDLHLGYVRTGDAQSDEVAKAGLDVLAATLKDRTAVEPAATLGVDPARDDLSPFPILYWRAPANAAPLSPAAVANLDHYMRLGGMLFLDTRDGGAANGPNGPAAVLLKGLDAPPLELVGGDHVLTKAFYLMRSFPGRIPNPRLFAETPASAAARDGVASLLVGDGDWAGAWQGAAPDRQREMALRFGVNLIMVALTGNYKTDQVHVGAILERLSRERPR